MCDTCVCFEDTIINKHLECLVKLKQENANYDKCIGYCSMAAFAGDIDILQYLIDNFENDLSEPVCNYAVIGGSLCCLIAAHSGGFVMQGSEITRNAALRGDVSCLRYAVSHGCNCESNICEYAVSKDSLMCFVYLLNRGFVCTEFAGIRAFLNGQNSDCYQYMLSHSLVKHEDIEEYSGLSLAQAITRYNRRHSYDVLRFLDVRIEMESGTTIGRENGAEGRTRSVVRSRGGYISDWRRELRANDARYDFELCGR